MAKGWHNEYERHSLAGMGIKTASVPMSVAKQQEILAKMHSTTNAYYSDRQKKFEDMFAKERKEHPRFSDDIIREIVNDHLDGKEPKNYCDMCDKVIPKGSSLCMKCDAKCEHEANAWLDKAEENDAKAWASLE